MTPSFRLAIPAGLLLLSISVVTPGQANDEAKAGSAFAPRNVQAPGQAASTGAPDTSTQLTAEKRVSRSRCRVQKTVRRVSQERAHFQQARNRPAQGI
jgi:hypothetical protein